MLLFLGIKYCRWDDWIPAEWHENQKTQIDALQEKLKPRIRVNFRPENGDFQHTFPKQSTEKAFRTFRIEIENLSHVPIRNCSVRMVSMVDALGTRSIYRNMEFKRKDDNHPNYLVGKQKAFDIRPRDSEFVELVCMNETVPDGRVIMLYADPDFDPKTRSLWNEIDVSRFPQTLTIRVVGDDVSDRVEHAFTISVSADRKLELAMLRK
jgi:hypothetical protein